MLLHLLLVAFLLVTGVKAPGTENGRRAPTSAVHQHQKGEVLEESTARDPESFFVQLCKGLGRYELFFTGGDDRSWISIKFCHAVADLREAAFKLSSGAFPNEANDVVEWRGTMEKGVFIPFAQIYLLDGSDQKTHQLKSRLIVVRLNKESSTVIGFTEGKDEDATAKRMADRRQPG